MIGIRLLGHFSVRRANKELPAPGRLVRTLISFLVVRRGSFVARDLLVEALWPTDPPTDPGANLKVLVSRARRLLGAGELLLTGPAGYSFAASGECRVDIEEFLEHVQQGRKELADGKVASALDSFEAAVGLWKGDPLAESAYEDWAQDFRTRLGAAYVEALEGGASAALGAGDPSAAARFAQLAAGREPLREACHLLLAEALGAAGDAASAFDVLQTFRRRLADEIGLDPSGAVDMLQTRLLNMDLMTRRAIHASSEARTRR